MPTMSSSDADIRVVSPSGNRYGPFKSVDGGDLTHEARAFRPPGGSMIHGHNPNGSRDDLTVVKDAELVDDIDAIEAEAGQPGWRVSLVRKDATRSAYGDPEVYLATLLTVNRPKFDTDEGAQTPELGLVFGVDELLA